LQIAEPKVLSTYAYDASGNLLSKTVQATSDTTGAQGSSPTLIGTARTWSYTYNTAGQILTVTGPRIDVADKTTYTYDSSGNLSTITNAVGQVTTLSNYDANGRVGLITDANGATTALTYSPRGWLTGKTVTVGSAIEATSYSYDGVGQLTLVTLPDTSTISYTYDPAHRLTNIADSLGNSIAYTLDNMGNRISEQVKDPSGALARQTSRVVDALNRIQQITGAAQ
jgi:YD repeat-containing protein